DLKQRLQRAIRFDTKILDAESRFGRMLDELMRSLEQDHQDFDQAGVAEDSGSKQLQLQRDKALKSDVFRYVNWLRTFAASHQLYVGLDDKSKPSPTAKPVEAPRGGNPQIPIREGGRKDAAKNNGRVSGKAETIVPKNRWKDGAKLLVNQPQRQKTERGVLLENFVRVVDVHLNSGSDVTVVTRDVMDALVTAGVEVGLSPIACRIWRTRMTVTPSRL
ncbi:hypothetical protein DYB28_005648, partial [Aphanomyces astaci]